MTLQQLEEFCRSLPEVTAQLSPAPASICRFRVGERVFAYYKTSEPERGRFSVRVTAGQFVELTDQPGIRPARYMARFHWVTLIRCEQFPDSWLRMWVCDSYRLAASGLGKRRSEVLCRQLPESLPEDL